MPSQGLMEVFVCFRSMWYIRHEIGGLDRTKALGYSGREALLHEQSAGRALISRAHNNMISLTTFNYFFANAPSYACAVEHEDTKLMQSMLFQADKVLSNEPDGVIASNIIIEYLVDI
jgi:hypothetical protein